MEESRTVPGPPANTERTKDVAVVYGASVPSARVIAERLEAGFQRRGFAAQLCPLQAGAELELGRFAAAVVIAPIPLGREEKSLLEFVRAQKAFLDRKPVAFLSMSVAGERPNDRAQGAGPSEDAQAKGAQFVTGTQMALDRVLAETGWRPTRQWPVAGSITYVRYNFLVRLILKLLAGGDPNRGSRREDWQALETFLDDFEAEIRARGPAENGPST
jgi:menaquinone-dependent protoporphyrinogen oxidase